ncbi:bilin-binding protein-like [Eurosta solidaginis]|uniref:bilin-binding protein-like n=1 Tax=Eurosta solidaginis TaxID=178769 RepID=UPI003530DB78
MLKHQFSIPLLSILIILTSSCLVAGQVRRQGVCPDMRGLSNVESEWLNYQGRWFMQARYENDGDNRCQKSDYTLGPNREHIVRDYEISNADNSINERIGILTFLQDGQFQIQYDGIDPINFKVLSVVYNRYLITYSCKNLPEGQYDEDVWIHTRANNPSQQVITAYKDALDLKGISKTELQYNCHQDCAGYLSPTLHSKRQRKC